jgi:hypothetical protein
MDDLVNYWSAYANPAAPLGLLQAGPSTNQFDSTYRADASKAAVAHDSLILDFSEEPSEAVALLVKNGALVFCTVDLTAAITPIDGQTLSEDRARTDWTALLAPGT